MSGGLKSQANKYNKYTEAAVDITEPQITLG